MKLIYCLICGKETIHEMRHEVIEGKSVCVCTVCQTRNLKEQEDEE